MDATSTGYLDVHGVHLYYETYGDDAASPLVLVHAGVLTIDLSFAALLPDLASRHRVVALELQGHGRTAHTDRPFTPAGHAGDVVALLDHLGIERPRTSSATAPGRRRAGAGRVNDPSRSDPARVGVSVRPVGHARRPDRPGPDGHLDPAARPPEHFAAMQEAYARLSPHAGPLRRLPG